MQCTTQAKMATGGELTGKRISGCSSNPRVRCGQQEARIVAEPQQAEDIVEKIRFCSYNKLIVAPRLPGACQAVATHRYYPVIAEV
jgi:hypothetical protein